MDAKQISSASRPSAKGRSPVHLFRLTAAVAWARWVSATWWTAYGRVSLWTWGAQVGPSLRIVGRIRLYVSGNLKIGSNVHINSGRANFVGGDRRMALRVGKDADLIIGDGCRMSNSTICAAVRIVIHDETFIGGGCDIYDSDFHPIDPDDRDAELPPAVAPIEIGPRAFIGSHVIILKGVRIGEGAVIGAGSVVTRNVPAFEIWAGRPARFLRKLESSAGSAGVAQPVKSS